MASFKSVLQVKGKQYTVLHSDFDIHQFTDSLGRPASPTFGGVYTLDIEAPPSGDSTLFEWMVEPALFLNGQVLIKNLTGTTLKVIKLYNAYCVDLEGHFDGTGRSGDQSSLRFSLRISPQAVRIGEQFHDNNWPAPEPIVDWHWADMDAQSNPKPQAKQEPTSTSVRPISNNTLQLASLKPVAAVITDVSNCSPAETMRLQREVVLHCKTRPSKCVNTDSCPTLVTNMATINDCIAARTKINMKCFKGGNAGHKQAIVEKTNSLINCQEIYFRKCMPKPTPVPAPERIPVPAPPAADPDFMKKMEQLTGLTGAALIIYLIISEGSRLFPPRNLVPIP